jgi:hypothetical protein
VVRNVRICCGQKSLCSFLRRDARGAHKHPADAPADVDDLVVRERPFVAIRHLPWVDVDERMDNNSESSTMIRFFFWF